MKSQTHKVFISHAWEDKALAYRVEDVLKSAGVEVWVDHSDVHGGDVIPERVSEAIEWCTDFVLIWSQAAGTSHWVKREWTAALNLNKTIVPCTVDHTEPPAILGGSAHIDFASDEAGLSNLIKALDLDIDQTPETFIETVHRHLRTLSHGLFSKRFLFTSAAASIVLALSLWLILDIAPKSTLVELEIAAKQSRFSLPSEIQSGEEFPLLYSALWVASLSSQRLRPFELTLEKLFRSGQEVAFHNPITIVPDSVDGRVTFNAVTQPSDLSLQEMVCDSGSQVTLRFDGEELRFEIRQSSSDPFQSVSLGERVNLSVQSCTVRDGAGKEMTGLFAQGVAFVPHPFSRSLRLRGRNGQLVTRVSKADGDSEEPTQFVMDELVADLDFSHPLVQSLKSVRESTVDSIFVKRNFPLKNITRKANRPGDLEIVAEPNRFLVVDFWQDKNALRMKAQARLRSLKIGHAAMMSELVPWPLAVMAEHQTILVVATMGGWLVAVLFPIVAKMK